MTELPDGSPGCCEPGPAVTVLWFPGAGSGPRGGSVQQLTQKRWIPSEVRLHFEEEKRKFPPPGSSLTQREPFPDDPDPLPIPALLDSRGGGGRPADEE